MQLMEVEVLDFLTEVFSVTVIRLTADRFQWWLSPIVESHVSVERRDGVLHTTQRHLWQVSHVRLTEHVCQFSVYPG